MSADLLPCPFCFGEAEAYEWDFAWCVICSECGCKLGYSGADDSGPIYAFESESEAAKAWNARAILTKDAPMTHDIERDNHMSMKERLARKLAERMCAHFIELGYPAADIVFHDWDTAEEPRKAAALSIIEAILQALREPSEGLFDVFGNGECAKWAPGVWQTLIDHIINEGK